MLNEKAGSKNSYIDSMLMSLACRRSPTDLAPSTNFWLSTQVHLRDIICQQKKISIWETTWPTSLLCSYSYLRSGKISQTLRHAWTGMRLSQTEQGSAKDPATQSSKLSWTKSCMWAEWETVRWRLSRTISPRLRQTQVISSWSTCICTTLWRSLSSETTYVGTKLLTWCTGCSSVSRNSTLTKCSSLETSTLSSIMSKFCRR